MATLELKILRGFSIAFAILTVIAIVVPSGLPFLAPVFLLTSLVAVADNDALSEIQAKKREPGRSLGLFRFGILINVGYAGFLVGSLLNQNLIEWASIGFFMVGGLVYLQWYVRMRFPRTRARST